MKIISLKIASEDLLKICIPVPIDLHIEIFTALTSLFHSEFPEMTKKTDVISVDICNKCHPFFTGKQKLVDTGGRVEKFNNRYNKK